MITVTLATHCHSRDLPRLHAPGELESLVASHQYPFDEILVIHQRCGETIDYVDGWYINDNGLKYQLPHHLGKITLYNILDTDYPDILKTWGLNPNDALLDEVTHGWNWQWYWQHHCVNHLKELMKANSDYIVFNDADCRILHQPSSWVEKGIELLETHSEILVVAPSDGGQEFNQMLADGTRLTLTSSQQLFMGKTSVLRQMDFTNLQWDGRYDAPFGPMQEFYGMFESWLWRWMRANNMFRAILPEQWRYWHSEWH